MLLVLAFLCFTASTIWSLIQRAWPFALAAAGLALWVLNAAPIHLG